MSSKKTTGKKGQKQEETVEKVSTEEAYNPAQEEDPQGEQSTPAERGKGQDKTDERAKQNPQFSGEKDILKPSNVNSKETVDDASKKGYYGVYSDHHDSRDPGVDNG